MQAAHKIEFTYTDEVVERIAERCTEVDTGARNIDFIIDKNVLPEASKALIARMADENMPAMLTLGIDEQGTFTYVFDDEVSIGGVTAPALQGDGAANDLVASADIDDGSSAEQEPGEEA